MRKKATKEQIQEWKAKHGGVFLLEVEDKVCYLRAPKRKELSAGATIGQGDPMKTSEFLLNACWLDGDEEIKTEDSYFMGASSQLDKIIEVKEAAIKKL